MMQTGAIAWVDTAEDSKSRKVLAPPGLQVPGVRMFGYHSTAHAIAALERHYHEDCFEFTFLIQGNVRFRVAEHVYRLSGGVLFFTLPDEVHDTASAPMSLHQMYWFQLDASDPAQFLYMAPDAAGALIRRLRALPARVVKMDPDEATPLLGAVFSYFSAEDPVCRTQGAQLLGFFLYRVLECSESVGFRLTPDIGRATSYIMEHLCAELPLELLAQQAMLSVPRFKQKFKAQLGISPRNFINSQKVELARQLLLEGHSVTDVAMELGFSSSNYFSSVFRRYTAMSPTQYLAANSKDGT